jgi:hypothetical protein
MQQATSSLFQGRQKPDFLEKENLVFGFWWKNPKVFGFFLNPNPLDQSVVEGTFYLLYYVESDLEIGDIPSDF